MILQSSNQTLSIVQAGPEFAPELCNLHKLAFARSWDISCFSSFLRDPNVTALVALRGRHPIPAGFLLVRMTAPEAEMLTIAVAPDRRREGIGSALSEAASEFLQARDITRLVLEVGEQNKEARRLYERLGFSTVGVRRAYYRKNDNMPGEDALIMALLFAYREANLAAS